MAVQNSCCLFSEGAFAGEDFVEHQPQRVDVAEHGDFPALQLLWGHVSGSAAADFRATDIVGNSRETEVGDDGLTATVEHDVGGLEVAVQNAFGVGGGEAGANLAGNLDGFVRWQAADAAQQGS